MIKQIPTNIDKKVLVLSSNCRVLANENIWKKTVKNLLFSSLQNLHGRKGCIEWQEK
jgi:hypothetical protein